MYALRLLFALFETKYKKKKRFGFQVDFYQFMVPLFMLGMFPILKLYFYFDFNIMSKAVVMLHNLTVSKNST